MRFLKKRDSKDFFEWNIPRSKLFSTKIFFLWEIKFIEL